MNIVVLVPAHNESDCIVGTLEGLMKQTVKPTRIVVITDNCTDNTAELSIAAGAEVFNTRGNTDKKAGALNQAIASVELGDYILCVDADTELVPGFIERALQEFEDESIGAVGGVFYGRKPTSLLERFQYNEYVRYARTLEMSGKTKVLSGTASLFKREVFEALQEARGYVYDPSALTEDMEVGLAVQTLGYRITSPLECRCTTELMPTWGTLNEQRVRWYRGAVENLLNYGVTKVTRSYWGQQIMLLVSAVMLYLYMGMSLVVGLSGGIRLSWFWSVVGLIFVVERVVTVWRAGWKSRILALVVLPELCYDLYLQRSFFIALWRIITRKESVWVHVERTANV